MSLSTLCTSVSLSQAQDLLVSLGPWCPASYASCLLAHPAACHFQNNPSEYAFISQSRH